MKLLKMLSLLLFAFSIPLDAQLYIKASLEPDIQYPSSSSIGLGYRLGRISPNFSLGWNASYDRTKDQNASEFNGSSEICPRIGIDFILNSQITEVYVPFQFGTYFWELPDPNYSFFSELGIGAQRRFDNLEISSDIGIYYHVVEYDIHNNSFSNHRFIQYVKIHMKYYFKN